MIKLLQGDVLKVLRNQPAASVQCCVTSPPYWGLRDYGVDQQLGLEKTPEEYVAKMVDVFREVRRVLRDDGTLWLNIGDSYSSSGGAHGGREDNQRGVGAKRTHKAGAGDQAARTAPAGLKPKDLVGIPWMLAFALRADGWYLRQDIIWAKPNPMPESVTDRCTKSHEHLFLLSKSERYYFDHEALKEPCVKGYAGSTFHTGKTAEHQLARASTKDREDGALRHRRDVWTVATQPYKEAHFAVFPERLVEPCLYAGVPERCCSKCGAPWKNYVVQHTNAVIIKSERTASMGEAGRVRSGGTQVAAATSDVVWSANPTCKCAAPPAPSLVLDPFCGSGTVGAVAKRLGVDFIGIDLNPAYLTLARKRIGAVRR